MRPNKKPIGKDGLVQQYREKGWEKKNEEFDEFSQKAITGLQYHNENEPLPETLRRLEQKVRAGSKGRAAVPIRRIMSIAAGFVILAMGVYFLYLQTPADDSLFAQHFTYLPLAMDGASRNYVARDSSSSGTGLKDAAIKAYEADNYDEAEGLIRAYINQVPDDLEMQFYYGVVLLGKGHSQAALPYLKKMMEQPVKRAYQRPASWYVALAFLAQEDYSSAKSVFKELATGEDKYAINSRALLKHLE
jgi:TolA-binding protein